MSAAAHAAAPAPAGSQRHEGASPRSFAARAPRSPSAAFMYCSASSWRDPERRRLVVEAERLLLGHEGVAGRAVVAEEIADGVVVLDARHPPERRRARPDLPCSAAPRLPLRPRPRRRARRSRRRPSRRQSQAPVPPKGRAPRGGAVLLSDPSALSRGTSSPAMRCVAALRILRRHFSFDWGPSKRRKRRPASPASPIAAESRSYTACHRNVARPPRKTLDPAVASPVGSRACKPRLTSLPLARGPCANPPEPQRCSFP